MSNIAKRAVLSFVIVFLLAVTAIAAPKYVASVEREPFHKMDCRHVKKINPGNAVYYETREDAVADGHRPCKVCNP